METNIALMALIGMLAGFIHVITGPDHLAAIAPLTADRPVKSWKIGLWWGLGHTGSVWLLGILMFLLKTAIPFEKLSGWSEKTVGLVLIGLGIWGLQKAFKSRVHYHIHKHDGTEHTHFHFHKKELAQHHDKHEHQHKHAPLGIGILHGFAGSSHLLIIIPALALPNNYSIAGYVGGFGIGTILMMTFFSGVIGLLIQKYIHVFTKAYRWTQFAFSFAAIGVGVFWLVKV